MKEFQEEIMKKLLSLLLVVSMILALGIAAGAVPNDETTKAPVSYLWLTNTSDNQKSTVLAWMIDAETFAGKANLRIFADVCFENIEAVNGGCAFANIYFYNSKNEIIKFEDWADSKLDTTPGEWRTWEYSFETASLDDFAYASVAVGFWQATGKVSIGPINISTNKEMFWTKSFNGPLDYYAEDIFESSTVNISEENEGVTFETVYEIQENVGKNLCLEDGVDITIIGGPNEGHTSDDGVFYPGSIYKGSLNDGICGAPDLVPDWFGFHKSSNATTGSIDDLSGDLGTVLIDLGEAKDFSRVRLYYWWNTEYAIGDILASRAYYSDDAENWTEFGDLLFDSETEYGWADTEEKGLVTARYVKVEYLYKDSPWGMISEVEVIAAGGDVVDDSSAPAEESKPADESKGGTTEPTSDSGFIALALIASLAVAGAVVIKKSR